MFNTKFKTNIKVLALGAHPDDVEIGAGGYLSRLRRELDAEINFGIMTYGLPYVNNSQEKRAKEAIEAVGILLGYDNETDTNQRVRFAYQKDCELHMHIHELIRIIEQWIEEIDPDLILTHAGCDLHDDHKQVFNATISAARDYHGDILIYQAPSTIPNEFSPNFFVEVMDEDFNRKVDAINKHSSQIGKRFMKQGYSDSISQAWSTFHRFPPKNKLEAFKVYQSFFICKK